MREQLSLYLHIPFCASKCNYCAFVSCVAKDETKERYVDNIIEEIKMRAKLCGSKYDVVTIYIGGGTPSSLPDGCIKRIMNAIYNNFNVKNDAEITIEINPNTITETKAEEYMACGINRYSIGLQSAQPHLLSLLGRTHRFEDFRGAVQLLKRKGATNISADIMIGLPMQKLKDIKETITFINMLGVRHISAYILSIETGTKFEKMAEQKRIVLPSDANVIKMYNLAYSELKELGYKRYEFSNFAKEGFQSKHNMVYWNRGQFLGFGVSAHSCVDNFRMANTSSIDTYDYHIKRNEIPLESKEELSIEDAKEETIMLSLRLEEGIDLNAYKLQFGADLLEEKHDAVAKLVENGFIKIANGRLTATEKGFLVVDKIISLLAI